jgi:prepilin-type N-terminal cleavage/methylation domain-containing protein/prepilin-type processing-associated H-X9-DG protein
MSRRRTRVAKRGFTLVELLVVIAIIGMLVAILLPAIQHAREAARRTQCANNLKQVALAALNYESARKKLPPSGTAEIRTEMPQNVEVFNPYGGNQYSWIVTLLPYLEQAPLAQRFDLSKKVFAQTSNPQAVTIPSLRCPSDTAAPAAFQQGYAFNKPFAKGNYAAYTSPFHVDLQLLYRGALVAGGQAIAAIDDGASGALAFAEIRTLDHSADYRGAWALPWSGASLLAFDMHPQDWSAAHGAALGNDYHAETNAPYLPNPDSLGKTQTPNNQGPNADTIKLCGGELQAEAAEAQMPCRVDASVGLRGDMSAAPRSLHSGGVNVAFLDGHVVFFSEEVDEYAMAYMVSVNDSRTPGTL